MRSSIFVLDANVFIEAARRYYAFDIAPPFWSSLIEYARIGKVLSIDRVKNELEDRKDQLASWVKRYFNHGFYTTDDDYVIIAYGKVMTWVQNQNQFFDAAKADFANGADGWLVAYAMVKGYVVVTHEAINPEIKRRVPIPNVCNAFNINYIDTFEMLRILKFKFIS